MLPDKEVRVDIWKPRGKWYTTLEIIWSRDDTEESEVWPMKDIFRHILSEQEGNRFDGYWASCLHPYHENAHPIMIILGE